MEEEDFPLIFPVFKKRPKSQMNNNNKHVAFLRRKKRLFH